MRSIPILVAATLAVASGCAPRDREVRLARVAGEKKNLEESLHRLEERLLADQARVRYWQEMRARHESVSAIACAVQDEHAADMAFNGFPPRSSHPLHRAKVASAAASVTKPTVRTDRGR